MKKKKKNLAMADWKSYDMIKITILVVRTVIKTSLQQKLRLDPSGRRIENEV